MASNTSSAPAPKKKTVQDIKSTILRPALTSHYQCWFNPPGTGTASNAQDVRKWVSARGFDYTANAEMVSLLCCEASLPGSQLATNEIQNDFHGVTERLAYRRLYDTVDFSFYVDHNVVSSTSYNIIWFFENWISYCVNETSLETENYTYRANFADGPSGYRSPAIYVNKLERDFLGTYLQYKFLKAYPISITSMPISYDSSQLLKCNVTFTYTRYVTRRYSYDTNASTDGGNPLEPAAPKAAPSTPQPTTTTPTQQAAVNSNLAIWALSNQKMINDVGHVSADPNNNQKLILDNAIKQYPPGSPQRAALLQEAQKYNSNVKF